MASASAPSKLAYLTDENGKKYAIYPALNKRREAGKNRPEEKVRLAVYNQLIEKYGYPAERLDIEFPVYIRADEQPRFADIVVFDDKEHKRPFVVVECKKPNREDGERQGQRYATILRAVYVLWTNGSDRACSVLVNRYPEEASTIADIPPFGGTPKFSIEKLQPFKDDREIAAKFRKCHDLIYSLNNYNPDEAFGEFLKILLVKLEDESRDSDYEFQILLRGQPPVAESVNETAQRVRFNFKQAVERESEYSSVFKGADDIKLTNECIAQLVSLLQQYSLSDSQVDQKGRAFETFLSGDLRQEFKEFMTPRAVIEAVVEMANPDPTVSILDPCCGSGGFLVYALQYVRHRIEQKGGKTQKQVKAVYDFAHDHLFGFDDSEQMAAVARINMLVNEDGRAHVFKHNSLYPRTDAPFVTQSRHFDFILTNPPFGKRISKPSSLLENFHLTRDERGRVKKGSFITEVLFLERNLEWLRPGGYMFIVLPDSVLGNSTLENERAYIERIAKLTAVFSLSADTFGPSGAKSKTSIAVFQKRTQPLEDSSVEGDYPVFVAHLEHVGYDFTGRATGKNELPTLVVEYKKYQKTGESKSAISAVVMRSRMGKNWLAQPHIRTTKSAKAGAGYLTLDQVCEVITTGRTAARAAYTPKGLHMVKVGNLTGKGIAWNAVERQFVNASFATGNARAVLVPNDILFTAAAHGPKWIGLKVDIFEVAPENVGSPVVCCGEIMICRPRTKASIGERVVDPYYLLLYLRSAAGYEAIQHCIRGQSGHVYPDEVRGVRIPDPDNLNQKLLADAILKLKTASKARNEATKNELEAEGVAAKLFPSNVKKPVIAS